jgi:hypothetical protein
MDQAKALAIVISLTATDIKQAYSGRPGCACGCKGRYYETKTGMSRVLREVQAAVLEHPYFDDLNQHDRAEVGWNVADDLQYVTCTVSPKRVYTVYLTSDARRVRGVEKGYDLD